MFCLIIGKRKSTGYCLTFHQKIYLPSAPRMIHTIKKLTSQPYALQIFVKTSHSKIHDIFNDNSIRYMYSSHTKYCPTMFSEHDNLECSLLISNLTVKTKNICAFRQPITVNHWIQEPSDTCTRNIRILTSLSLYLQLYELAFVLLLVVVWCFCSTSRVLHIIFALLCITKKVKEQLVAFNLCTTKWPSQCTQNQLFLHN